MTTSLISASPPAGLYTYRHKHWLVNLHATLLAILNFSNHLSNSKFRHQ